MDHERETASFSPEALSSWLHGGNARLARRQWVRDLVEPDPVFRVDDLPFLSRTERASDRVWGAMSPHLTAARAGYARGLEKVRRAQQLRELHGLTDDEYLWLCESIGEDLPSFLHDGVFVPGIKGQGSEEQAALWGPLAEKKVLGAQVLRSGTAAPLTRTHAQILIGCYAQTELGHGSNVQALETTATFIPESDEIELHTPTLSATKVRARVRLAAAGFAWQVCIG